jgi:hypothetical protein
LLPLLLPDLALAAKLSVLSDSKEVFGGLEVLYPQDLKDDGAPPIRVVSDKFGKSVALWYSLDPMFH